MLHYLIQILLIQFCFLIIYDFFLKNETFYNWNRGYLVIIPVITTVIPFIKVSSVQNESYYIQNYIIEVNRIIEHSGSRINEISTYSADKVKINWWIVIYGVGLLINLILFSYKLYSLSKIKKVSETKIQDKTIIIMQNNHLAFSFWNSVYIGNLIPAEYHENIIKHERIHLNQKHSIDQIYYQILKIIFWWNPLIYIFNKRITALHEFIVDGAITLNENKKTYAESLLNHSFQSNKISFTNNFLNQSLIKERIHMLLKSRSSNYAKLKYLIAVPLIANFVLYTSCNKETESTNTSTFDNTNFTKSNSFNSCLNKNALYDNDLDNYLKLITKENTEVIAHLVSTESNKSIRSAHLKENSTIKLKYIPEGIYRLDLTYGTGITETELNGQCQIQFKTIYKKIKGNDILDFNTIYYKDEVNLPSYSFEIDLLNQKNKSNNEENRDIAEKTIADFKDSEELLCANKSSAYDKSLDNYLKISNGDRSEVIVYLLEKDTRNPIRKLHLQESSDFYAKNIPEGVYQLEIWYGKELIKKQNQKSCDLEFKNQFTYERGKDNLNFRVVNNSVGVHIPSYSIRLNMDKNQ